MFSRLKGKCRGRVGEGGLGQVGGGGGGGGCLEDWGGMGNSNLKTLFYKDCSLGSFENLTSV